MNSDKEKLSFNDRLVNFLTNNRIIFLVVFIVLVLAFAGYIITTTMLHNSNEKTYENLNKIITEYSLLPEEDKNSDDELDRVFGELENLAESALGFSKVKVFQSAGELAVDNEDWERALDYYTSAIKKCGNNYLKPVLYMARGAVLEEIGDSDSALLDYLAAAETVDFPFVGQAYLNAGAVEEVRGNSETARVYYNKVIENSPYTTLSSLAQSRLIILDIEAE